MKIMGATITDLDTELKMKTSKIEYLEKYKNIIVKMEECNICLTKEKSETKRNMNSQ